MDEEDFMKGLDETLSQDNPSPPVIIDDEKKKEEERLKDEEIIKKSKEEEIIKDDDEPIFKKEGKQKKTKEESNAELRKSRDDYKGKTDKYIEVLGDHDPEILKPLLELITERADGPITKDFVSEIVTELKDKDAEIADLKKSLEEGEKKVASIDVQYSKDFETKYKLPYKESVDNLIAEYANVDDDGKILAPKLTQELHDFFLNNADKIDGIGAKRKLQEFAKKYKEETGEDAVIPSINSLMSSLRSFNSKRAAMKDAYDNWQTKKKEDETKSVAEQERDRETIQKKNRKERVALSSKAFRDFDIDDIDIPEDLDMEEVFKEEFRRGEKIFAGEEVPSYDTMITRGVKAQLFDKIRPILKELQEFKKAHSEKGREHLRGSDAFEFSKTPKNEGDWLDGALKD